MKLLVGIFAIAAFGAPLVLTESTDFPSVSGAPIGALDIGFNTVDGGVAGRQNPLGGDLYDAFSVTLPAGMSLISIESFVTDFTYGQGPFSITFNGQINSSPISGNGQFAVPFVSSPGDYAFTIQSPSGDDDNGRGVMGGMTYQLQLTVQADAQLGIPEPSTWALCAAAFLGMARLRK
jgi:hypothetical protein